VSPSQRPRTRLDPEVRREQIVEAAEQVFQGRDPADVAFEEIAEAAGVSRALVYNYFGDKGGLIAAVYLRSLRRLDEELDRAVDPDAPDGERLHSVVRCYLRFANENSAAWRLIGSTATMEHPEVLSARNDRFAKLARNWGDTAEARVAARAVIGFLESATLDWLEYRDLDVDRLADLLFTILWTGLSAVDRSEAQVPTGRPTATALG
jgi:AcrR family transcriptional regulator